MPTCLTFLVFGFSANILLVLLTSWLLALYARNVIYIMASCICMASQQSSAGQVGALLRLGWWKLVSSLLLILTETDAYDLYEILTA